MSFYYQSHVPAWSDVEPLIPKQEFETIDALLSHPDVKRYVPEPGNMDDGRHAFRFCWDYSYDGSYGDWTKALLIADWIDRYAIRKWLVIGYMSEVPTALPRWKAPVV